MINRSSNWKVNYPIPLKPTGKDYLWGGERLNIEFNKNIDMSPLAETWECSTHLDGPSLLLDNTSLVQYIRDNPIVLGLRHQDKTELPLLIKLIDARDDLSIQVHPNDEYARSHENGQLGKTEMWYVIDATKDAKIIYGLNKDYSKEEIRASLIHGSILDKLQIIDVKKDDVFYIPSGIVHAIGAGVLLAEIQESSNLTYRIFDYDRIDKDGKRRELHIEKALDVMNYNRSPFPRQPMRVLQYRTGIATELLSRCKYFEVYRMIVNANGDTQVDYHTDNLAYRVLLCISGSGYIQFDDEEILFDKGNCVFVPADSVLMKITGRAIFLEVRG